jgi:hypothetical protein
MCCWKSPSAKGNAVLKDVMGIEFFSEINLLYSNVFLIILVVRFTSS